MLETLLHTRTQPGVWITNHPISLGWSVQRCWLPLIGYHNTGSGEEQLLPLDTWRRRLFNRNYIHHISRLADKLTSGWNRAKTKPGRVTRQVLHPPAPHIHRPCPGCWLTAAYINSFTWQRGRKSVYQLRLMCDEGSLSVLRCIWWKLQERGNYLNLQHLVCVCKGTQSQNISASILRDRAQ